MSFFHYPGHKIETTAWARVLALCSLLPHGCFLIFGQGSTNHELLAYSLVQWNWFSDVTGCTWISCIQWRQRTHFTAPGCASNTWHHNIVTLSHFVLCTRAETKPDFIELSPYRVIEGWNEYRVLSDTTAAPNHELKSCRLQVLLQQKHTICEIKLVWSIWNSDGCYFQKRIVLWLSGIP